MTNIKGAIFDVDGTILDSMPIWENVAGDFLKSRGIMPRPDLNERLSTLGGSKVSEFLRAEYGIDESKDKIRDGVNGFLADFYFNIAPLKDGILDILNVFQELGIKMCVATATDRCLIEPALERCGILGYFGRIFTCGEEDTTKRHPDIYIRASAFLGTDIADTLVFEDALYAVKTVKNAGFPLVAIYDLSAHEHQDEIRRICDVHLESPADFPMHKLGR